MVQKLTLLRANAGCRRICLFFPFLISNTTIPSNGVYTHGGLFVITIGPVFVVLRIMCSIFSQSSEAYSNDQVV